MNKAVSVVVPCYCVKDVYFEGLMKSLLNQSLGKERLEIILVDDGSPDNTYEKLQEYERCNPDTIMVIHCSENGGSGSARTIGLSYATGEYVAFADQDDWLDLGMYQLLYERGKEFECDVVKCGWCRENALYKPTIIGQQEYGEFFEVRSKEERQELFDKKDLGGYWAALYSRNMLLDNHIFFPPIYFYDDNFFSGLVHYYGKRYYFYTGKLYHWYINNQSVSMGNNLSKHTDRLKVELLLLEELEKRGLLGEYYNNVEVLFFERFFLNTMSTLISRQGGLPLSLWNLMRTQLLFHFPKFAENPIICEKHVELYQKNWIGTIVQWIILEVPEIWESDKRQKDYEDLKEFSFMELILMDGLTQSQWELIQLCYMVLQRIE